MIAYICIAYRRNDRRIYCNEYENPSPVSAARSHENLFMYIYSNEQKILRPNKVGEREREIFFFVLLVFMDDQFSNAVKMKFFDVFVFLHVYAGIIFQLLRIERAGVNIVRFAIFQLLCFICIYLAGKSTGGSEMIM